MSFIIPVQCAPNKSRDQVSLVFIVFKVRLYASTIKSDVDRVNAFMRERPYIIRLYRFLFCPNDNCVVAFFARELDAVTAVFF